MPPASPASCTAEHPPPAGPGLVPASRAALFVGSDVFRKEAFGANHPLSIPRQSGVLELCEALGWFEGGVRRRCQAASPERLRAFHDPDYIEALRTAERERAVAREARERYRIGTMENPLFEGLFERAATAVGGSILAAELALEGHTAFHPAGGTHHGRPDRAAGFCYFNDPVFAILTLLEAGLERVLYVDLDAHHGDGVQDAFAPDRRVFTLSIHEGGRWPYSGSVEDRGGGRARNLPVPAGFNDSELDFLMSEAVLPLAREFSPEAVVITCGADGLAGDPLSKLALSNGVLWRAVEQLVELTGRTVVLGGGGYNPWTVARCWAGLWGRLSHQAFPAELPPTALAMLKGFSCDLVDDEELEPAWLTTIADTPRTGPVRSAVREVAGRVRSPRTGPGAT
ncbi:MAG: acetoin utilization protein AcuC [Xanthomonadales bacterium]|nr:acetoin utilization protein AcuC [Xanthomonadales bacterium]NIN59162.1 acetoin utilization protein AcuC [Xanthomonadales bacterium]NIN74488.1 acetoin utilization protein AcuC [Xanthomonadales bacterium]NIO12472.1 acetoin utilization protein AcuC [Xanthomonadales bacterium]NIP11555.1 acetoin utilization protein AcuC [Xanthomonadales bacterium]